MHMSYVYICLVSYLVLNAEFQIFINLKNDSFQMTDVFLNKEIGFACVWVMKFALYLN